MLLLTSNSSTEPSFVFPPVGIRLEPRIRKAVLSGQIRTYLWGAKLGCVGGKKQAGRYFQAPLTPRNLLHKTYARSFTLPSRS